MVVPHIDHSYYDLLGGDPACAPWVDEFLTIICCSSMKDSPASVQCTRRI